MSNEIANYLKYADLQMAAEADQLDRVLAGQTTLSDALIRGNNRSSRFTATQAAAFADPVEGWSVVDHKANTSTGFSGTLFKSNKTGELVMSFRSTEFADDAARDNQATNDLEIRSFGWAFGQISDMQIWVDGLLDSNKINLQQTLTVTGYSLGGHLAAAFDLLYPNAATSIYTFNGAGVGRLNSSISLESVISAFDQRRSTGSNSDLFTDASVQDLYDTYKNIVSYVNGVVTVEVIDSALLQAKTLTTQLSPNTAGYGEALLLVEALQRSKDIAAEAVRVTDLSSGNGNNAVGVALVNIEAFGLDYQLAVLQAGEKTSSYGDEDAIRKAFGGLPRTTDNRANVFDVYGATTPSMVSNSQRHLGVGTPVWIEDQPFLRGSAVAAVYNESSFANGVKLLAPNFSANDFGDTHSLVLLVDSLNVQNTLAQLDPALNAAKIKSIFDSASNAAVETGFVGSVGTNNQGKADGDTLERVLNALADMLGLGWQGNERLNGSLDGNTWALVNDPDGYSGRTKFHAKLKAITDTSTYQSLLGKATIVPISQASDAKTNFGSFLALSVLSPFAIQTTDTTAVAKLKQANESLAQLWEADAELTLAQKASGLGTFTNSWYADRADMLKWIVSRNTTNVEEVRSPGVFQAAIYSDVDSSTLFSVANTSASAQSLLQAKRVIFGGDGVDELGGGEKEDHLYGGDDRDTLDGKAGDDYLEGGAGNDDLKGDEGQDTLLGGTGNDQLDGGAGADILKGGAGTDTYTLRVGDIGVDTIVDADGLGSIKVIAADNSETTLGGVINKLTTSNNTWQSEDKRFTYTTSQEGDGSTTLLVSGAGVTARVNKFTSGHLGITLPEAPAAEPAPPPAATTYDLATTEGKAAWRSSVLNPELGYHLQNAVQPRPGDLISSAYWEQGLRGDDRIEGGATLAIGQAVLRGNGGNDRMYAQLEQTLQVAIELGETLPGSASANYLVDGGAGNDLLVGSAGADVLFGGAGDDTIVGGAGDDLINSDGDAGAIAAATGAGWVTGSNNPLTGEARRLDIVHEGARLYLSPADGTGQRTASYAHLALQLDATYDIDYQNLRSLTGQDVRNLGYTYEGLLLDSSTPFGHHAARNVSR